MSKTIKQIADELGVSKTAIRKKMTDEVKTKFAETVSGVVYISEDGENIIKKGFLKSKPETELSGVSGNQFAEVSGEFAAIIEVLQKQLAIKDMQIEQQQKSITELTAALENTTSSLKAAQALHAGTIQQQLAAGEQQEERAGFFRRIFGGNEKNKE